MYKIENWNRQYDSLVHIGRDGTIKNDVVIKPNEKFIIEEDNKRNFTDEQIKIISSKSELKRYTTDLGGYIHMCYINNELLFNKLNIDRANISRLIYLATYIDYNDKQENLIIDKDKFNQDYPMTRKDIQYKLKLSDVSFRRFMSDIKKANLVYEVDKKIYMNPEYFSRGKSNFENKNYTRIFINPTRILYENSTPRQHKQLSYIFQLIPFADYELNIICENPNEPDFRKIKRLNLEKICKMLGLSTEARQMRNFRNELLKFYIQIGGCKYYFLSYAKILNGYGIKDYFTINPKISWAGKNTDILRDIIDICYFE